MLRIPSSSPLSLENSLAQGTANGSFIIAFADTAGLLKVEPKVIAIYHRDCTSSLRPPDCLNAIAINELNNKKRKERPRHYVN